MMNASARPAKVVAWVAGICSWFMLFVLIATVLLAFVVPDFLEPWTLTGELSPMHLMLARMSHVVIELRLVLLAFALLVAAIILRVMARVLGGKADTGFGD